MRSQAQDGDGMPPAADPKGDEPRADEPPKGGLRELAPSWRPGLEWDVITSPLVFSMPKDPRAEAGPHRDPSRKIKIHFAVKGVKTIEANACHEVVVTSDHRPGETFTLLVRTQDLSLKELRHRLKSGNETVVKNGRAPFLSFETSSLCSFDFPLFPRDSKNDVTTFELGEGRKLTQTVKLDEKRNATIELKAKVGDDEIVSTQEWKRGQPFWSKETRTRNGKLEESAEVDEGSIHRDEGEGK